MSDDNFELSPQEKEEMRISLETQRLMRKSISETPKGTSTTLHITADNDPVVVQTNIRGEVVKVDQA